MNSIISHALLKSFGTNLFLSIIKVLFGFLGRSSALIADGIHSFSDLATDGVAIFGNYYSLKPADEEHPYGHGRFEYLTCLIIGFVVVFLGYEIIIKSSFDKIIIPNKLIILISIFTIFIKHILSSYLIKIGEKFNNKILIASGKESKADVISSLFVLISSILMQFSKDYSILKYSNLVATVVVGLLIIKTGLLIIKDNFSAILGETEDIKNVNLMKEIINDEEKINNIDSLIVLKNGPYLQITCEVSMDYNLTLKEVHDIIEKIEENIKMFDNRVKYINIHVNPSKKLTSKKLKKQKIVEK